MPTRNHGTNVDTRVVHGGRDDLRDLGVHAPPIDRSTTNPITSLEDGTASIDALAAGGRPEGSSIYARLHNPTVARWETAIAELEGAEAAVAFASGMAGITALLLSVGAVGRHVIVLRPVYGGTDHLLASGLLGAEVTYTDLAGVPDAMRPDTVLVLAETPANPLLNLLDIAALVAAAGDVPVAIDNTFATPVLQNPLAHGAAYAVHSATKALGGHGDVMGGVVACSEERARPLRQVRIVTGGVMDPEAAFLLHRGLQTLALRVRAAQANAVVLARRLAEHPAVVAVHHPSLDGQDPEGLIGRQMRGPGSVLAFDVATHESAAWVLKAVELITPAVSLGSNDTLIEHPAGLTHRVVDPAALEATGITPGMLRLAVGIEDVEDLWADLAAALDKLPAA